MKPVECMAAGLGRVTMGWDEPMGEIYLKLNNIPHGELQEFRKLDEICREKVVETVDGKERWASFTCANFGYNEMFSILGRRFGPCFSARSALR